MTLDKARQLLKVQAAFDGFYNANGAKLILAEVNRFQPAPCMAAIRSFANSTKALTSIE
jgi:hypothetical protein